MNGSADGDQIWCVFRDQAAMYSTQVAGGIHLLVGPCVRADVPPFPYLENGLTDCTKIWYVFSDPSARLFSQVNPRLTGGGAIFCKLSFFLRYLRKLRTDHR